jgi:hypothetical protein
VHNIVEIQDVDEDNTVEIEDEEECAKSPLCSSVVFAASPEDNDLADGLTVDTGTEKTKIDTGTEETKIDTDSIKI